MALPEHIRRIGVAVWELPVSYKQGMRVPARIYGTEKLISGMDQAVYDQVTNVATLPGITQYALCMPDGHFGYGFPIGGVAAMDPDEGGVISPGGCWAANAVRQPVTTAPASCTASSIGWGHCIRRWLPSAAIAST